MDLFNYSHSLQCSWRSEWREYRLVSPSRRRKNEHVEKCTPPREGAVEGKHDLSERDVPRRTWSPEPPQPEGLQGHRDPSRKSSFRLTWGGREVLQLFA